MSRLTLQTMKRRTLFALAATAILAVWGSACRRSTQATGAVTADAAPQVVETAFQRADPAVRAEAASVAAATRLQDPAALGALTQMQQRPELSVEQRIALGRCLPAALKAARAAADRGDIKAAEALKVYNAGK